MVFQTVKAVGAKHSVGKVHQAEVIVSMKLVTCFLNFKVEVKDAELRDDDSMFYFHLPKPSSSLLFIFVYHAELKWTFLFLVLS